jgi:hypothetical protein
MGKMEALKAGLVGYIWVTGYMVDVASSIPDSSCPKPPEISPSLDINGTNEHRTLPNNAR